MIGLALGCTARKDNIMSKKKQAEKLARINSEFQNAKSETEIAKLIFKYGDKKDKRIMDICRKYMKYDTSTASDFISRDADAEYTIMV